MAPGCRIDSTNGPLNGCLLVFSDVPILQPARSDREIANAVLGGWHSYPVCIEDALAGRTVDPLQPEPDYDSREGPGRLD